MRRSGQPSRPRARICCLLSSPKMLAIPAGDHALHRRVNVLARRYFTGPVSGVPDWPGLGVHRGRAERAEVMDQSVQLAELAQARAEELEPDRNPYHQPGAPLEAIELGVEATHKIGEVSHVLSPVAHELCC